MLVTPDRLLLNSPLARTGRSAARILAARPCSLYCKVQEMFQSIDVKITGISPLIMHNGQTADPLNKFSKAIKEFTSKRKKTDADLEEIARLEWFAGLYVDKEGYAIIPSVNMEACIGEGAKVQKLGKQFKSAVFVDKDVRVQFPGIRPAEELWSDEEFRDSRGVRVQQSRVIRMRPIFHDWSCEFTVGFNDELVNVGQVQRAIEDAGIQKGLLDHRPKFGRFEAEFTKSKAKGAA